MLQVTGLKKRRRAAAASAAEVEVGREESSMAEDEEEGEKPPQTPVIAVHGTYILNTLLISLLDLVYTYISFS